MRATAARGTSVGLMKTVPYLGTEIRSWQVGNSTFLASPEMGARLMHWHLTLGDGTLREILLWPELNTLDDFGKVRGGNPILFPFNGRTFDQGEIFNWRGTDGVRRAIPIHGIARQGKFKIDWINERGFSAVFVPGDEAKAAYPYDYEFHVTYRFEALSLMCELTLRNLGTQPIPWSAGHHFYFAVPWSEGQTRSDYAIRIPATRTLRQNATGQLLPGPVFKETETLSNPALVDTFHLGLQRNSVVFGPTSGSDTVTVRLGTAKVPPPEATFVTWSADATAPFYCVEPWMGPANAWENKVGLQWVAPGQTQNFTVEVEVK